MSFGLYNAAATFQECVFEIFDDLKRQQKSSWMTLLFMELLSIIVLIILTKFYSNVGDEGMTCGSSILAYLVFGPGRTSTKETARPTKMMAWHGPGARLDVQGKARGDQVKLGLG
jgi:hypothetical protein